MHIRYVRLRADALGQRGVALKTTPGGGSVPTRASNRWSSDTYCPSGHLSLKPCLCVSGEGKLPVSAEVGDVATRELFSQGRKQTSQALAVRGVDGTAEMPDLLGPLSGSR